MDLQLLLFLETGPSLSLSPTFYFLFLCENQAYMCKFLIDRSVCVLRILASVLIERGVMNTEKASVCLCNCPSVYLCVCAYSSVFLERAIAAATQPAALFSYFGMKGITDM